MHRKEDNIASIYFDSKRGVTDVSTEVRASWAHARVYMHISRESDPDVSKGNWSIRLVDY